MRKSRRLLTILAMAFVIMLTAVASVQAQGNTLNPHRPIRVDGGRITGMLSEDGEVSIYKGIPYAAPPVDELRWKAPAPVVRWNGVKEAVEFGPSCWQTDQTAPILSWTEEFLIELSGDGEDYSEDCLTLNVWTNAKETGRRAEKLPVIVWIHGGGNTSGGSSVPVYDGEALARKDVVFVSINYRLGIFGFFSHPELSAENRDGISGNYAYLDQIAALEWVQRNIAKFGGDPNNVTIAGQSAGAGNVGALSVTPLATGLFQNAVTMSGSSPNFGSTYLADQELANQALYEGYTLEDLRAVPAEELWSYQYRGGALIDGVVFPMSFGEAYATGNVNHVNFMTGNVEGDSHFRGTPNTMPIDIYEQYVHVTYGDLAEKALELYPAPETGDEAIGVYLELVRDSMAASSNAFAQVRSLSVENPTYVYFYHHYMPPGDNETDSSLVMRFTPYETTLPGSWGAFHTAEVPYFLNYFSPRRVWSDLDYEIGDNMSTYLVNFAKTGNPNGYELLAWGPYNGAISFMDFGDSLTTVQLSAAKEAFWAERYGTYGDN
ncbi:MAG: carboxylesterase family protein [Ardenticatenaceae bacterium]|nr:carboxylesterase family protein [Ardenticatenaceae bacterium]